MLVDQWVETVWTVPDVREKTLKDYKHLYKNHLKSVIGGLESLGDSFLQIRSIYAESYEGIH